MSDEYMSNFDRRMLDINSKFTFREALPIETAKTAHAKSLRNGIISECKTIPSSNRDRECSEERSGSSII